MMVDIMVDKMLWMVAYAPKLFCMEEVFAALSSIHVMNFEDINLAFPVLKPLRTLRSWSSTDGEMPVATLCESLKGQ